MTATITREQAIRIIGSETELNRRILGYSDELARLRGGVVKLFSKGRLGPNPTFELRSVISDGDDDIREIIEALEHGELGFLSGSRVGC